MQCVILAGGLGTRLREETETRPKPMIEIGGKPILWHIMKGYYAFGVKDFVICAGYKGHQIKEYFNSFAIRSSNTTFKIQSGEVSLDFAEEEIPSWTVTIVDTGEDTPTGGRIKAIEKLIHGDFFCTYGDGLSDVDLNELVLLAEKNQDAHAVITAVNPRSRYGKLVIEDSQVLSFDEKPLEREWVNGGFFLFRREIFQYLDLDSVLETDLLSKLAKDKLLCAYKHEGFWQSMDTYREFLMLNEYWRSGSPKWTRFWSR